MLSSLPVEILEKIITYAAKDASKLRQTCRIINATSLAVIWRQVTISNGGVLRNAFFRYLTAKVWPVRLIYLYKDYIRVVTVMMQEYGVEGCENVPDILELIWQEASGIVRVNLVLEQSLLQMDPIAYEWLDIVTGPFQKSEPQVVAVQYCSHAGEYYELDYSNYFHDTLSTVQMILRMKNIKIFKFKVKVAADMALNLNFFRDVGKYIKSFEFHANTRTIFNFNDAIKHCTSLTSLELWVGENRREGNYEYKLPDSVRTITLHSFGRFLHTIRGAQVRRIELWDDSSVRIRGTMPNLKALDIGRISEDDPEAFDGFRSLLATSRRLKKVTIDHVYAHVIVQISDILDRVRVSSLWFEDISDVETMPDVSTKTMRRGKVIAYITHEDADNTVLLWHYFRLLLEKVPGMVNFSFRTDSEFSPLPEYTKQMLPKWYEVDLDGVKQHLETMSLMP
ncbi:hypothetical protein TRVA0_009S02388 [Trichomonascus vanleenenianus]|uniref:uncharacterized protein n=1 Tax=Trichomonascus vanleenenianus TaxID=2268995 RepID=UPI003ECB68AB